MSELTVAVAVCTRPVQARQDKNPNMERLGGHDVRPQPWQWYVMCNGELVFFLWPRIGHPCSSQHKLHLMSLKDQERTQSWLGRKGEDRSSTPSSICTCVAQHQLWRKTFFPLLHYLINLVIKQLTVSLSRQPNRAGELQVQRDHHQPLVYACAHTIPLLIPDSSHCDVCWSSHTVPISSVPTHALSVLV